MPRRAIDRRSACAVLWLCACAPLTIDAAAPSRDPMATCSNTGCHGAATGRGHPRRSSYAVWAAQDPHAYAYRVLFGEASRSMVAKLSGGEAPVGEDYERYVNENCAACHASAPVSAGAAHRLAWGVACDGCHGEPSGWLEAHVAGGRELSRFVPDAGRGWEVTNADYGLRDLGDAVTAAHVCARCHVGSSESGDGVGRDVNHDLIAAGHPRLAFEYTSHLANLPPHWETTDVAQEQRLRQWAIGRLVAAEAAVDLLVERAHSGPWPEFAEYDCSGCHHGLASADRRVSPRGVGGVVYDWGSWYFALIADDQSPRGLTGRNSSAISDRFNAVGKEMNRPLPRPERLATDLGALRGELRRAIASDGPQRYVATRLPVSGSADVGWDAAVQFYLLKAHLAGGGRGGALAAAFRALEPPDEVNGPLWQRYDPETARAAVLALQRESE